MRMCDNELISVIVPVYNTEKYIRQTLDSVVNQTYKNLEILIVDDGSTDGSPDICDEYRTDGRVKVFHRPNEGVAASRQFGVDVCNGSYFVTLDSDDYVADDYVEKLYLAIKKNDADVSVCGVSVFTDGMDNFSVVYMPPSSYEKLAVTKELLATDYYRIFLDLMLSDAWNKMFRTQFVRDSGVKYQLPNIYNGPEMKMNLNLTLHCPIYCVCRESLLFHRVRWGSRIQRKDKPMQDGFEIITESLLKECESLGLSIKAQLGNVYYWLIGIVVQDIMLRGGGVRERHTRFKKLISQNNRFLEKHKDDLEKHKGFRKFKVGETVLSLPAFCLGNALWLDAASLVYSALRRVKYR